MTASYQIRKFIPTDRDWLISAHRDHYTRVDGFDDSFTALVSRSIDEFISNHDPQTERGWVLCDGDIQVGCIFCVRLTGQVAKIRLFLIQEAARGQGQGRRLLADSLNFARIAGYREVQLWTHESHRAACALYAKTGWTLLDSYPVRSFGQNLTEQNWSIQLQ